MSSDLSSSAVPTVPRLWPADPPAAAPIRVLVLALVVGAVGALALRLEALGAAVLLVGAATLAVALGSRDARPSRTQLLHAVAACALLAVCAVRGAEWLAVLCLLAAVAVGSLALVEARTWTGLLVGACAAALVPLRTLRWVQPVLTRLAPRHVPLHRAGIVGIVTLGLLLVFGGLFAAADAAYAAVLQQALPEEGLGEVVGRLVILLVIAVGVLLAARLAVLPPAVDGLAPGPGRAVARWEWALPLALLDALFVSFVLVQLTVLFGGRAHVLQTQGLTYAEYARQGFWQLLVVTALTLLVVAFAVRTAPRRTAGDQALVRVLLGVLCVMALVIVASAVHRMSLYQAEYGFTRLRLLVDVVEISLGAVFVLLLVAGVRLSGTWLPRAVLAVGCAALLGLAVVNPDAWIARHNVDRFAQTGNLDVGYLATLSADAVPALLELPPAQRSCALLRVAALLRSSNDPWYDANLARSRARQLLAAAPVGRCPAVSPRTPAVAPRVVP